MATFFQSPEVEGGAKGRAKALKLLERAHSAFDASLASGWMDVGLVQAAWVSRLSTYLFSAARRSRVIQLFAVFENQAHPLSSAQRVRP